MSFSTTVTESRTFTVTHARYLASKISTDLKRIQRFYPGHITDDRISDFEQEVTEYLKAGYLQSVTYGFQRDGKWVEPTVRYSAQQLLDSEVDDDPGKIRPNRNVEGARFASYLIQNDAWGKLTGEQKKAFEEKVVIKRVGAPAPSVNGYFESDLKYTAGGQSLMRSRVRSFG
ncbi:hypothetical protein QGM61_06480 [Pseudohongiella sp. SYSU M77423]|uniref:HORMA-1 domain-containing protein n=1 Tax=Pseudohongiella sp. SYSU M77423 TaxID=3042312 RepID=UPI002480EEA4|nr:hypothetical protein [Pseudohongiella sp. SYSU M77423]MDH7943461.1 hypothetical protein [Pseudohongiella sp. SYSU M77423]